MRQFLLAGAAATALVLMTGSAVFAGTIDDGMFTITATNSKLTTTYAGASTFADSTTFTGYAGSVATSVANITGGALNPGGSTNPDSGIDNSIANYLAASSGNTETIVFGADQKYFGTLWGSVDATNTISLYDGSTLLAAYTGAELGASVGLEGYPSNGSFVDFVADSSSFDFNKIVLSEDATFFETDNYASLSAAVPEPISLSLFGAGLAGAAAMRRRKKANKA
jgi:hypothetical protein